MERNWINLNFITRKIHNYRRKKEWQKRNPHNSTVPVVDFPFERVIVGNATYGDLYVSNFSDDRVLRIGNFCSIAAQVAFLLSSDHNSRLLSSYPFKVQLLKSVKHEAISKGDIIVDDDVWIGHGAIILSGVHIGQGAIIAAGSVVSKDVPPYAIVAGVPAITKKYRFERPVIDYLLTLDYSLLSKEMIQEHISELYDPLDAISLQEIEKRFIWFPKKHDQTAKEQ